MKLPLCSLVQAVVLVSFAGGLAGCADSPRTPASFTSATADIAAGKRLYRVSCAGCHGVEADGLGPIAPLLSVKVPDLHSIAARRDGEFPELEIFRIIDGQSELAGHGPRHMPVWGYEFFGDDADDETAHRQATEKIDQLVAYLRSIQR